MLKEEVSLRESLLIKNNYIFIIRKTLQKPSYKWQFKEGALSLELQVGHLDLRLHYPKIQAAIHESLKLT
jgi:hypothetical protein